MLVKLRNILFSLCFLFLGIFSQDLSAREAFSFNIGDEVNVYSDKAYRSDTINKLVGNVVITHYDETLYGEAATIDLVKGYIEVEGNIRYVSELMTVYGSKLIYDTHTAKMTIENARVISESYSLIGKSITKISPEVFLAEEAEYTTCKDCPESWSVYGKHVRITVNNYVHVQKAMIKINGVNVIFLPYLVLPIKNERETGLLMPSFSLFNREGIWYQQPWFWAINKHADMTLTPSTWGRRGYGTDVEYRQLFGEEKWANINSRLLQDKIYEPNKSTTEHTTSKYFRQFSEYEHHFQFGNSLTHHAHYTNMSDLDLVKVFRAYTDPKIQGSELGLSSFFDLRTDHLSISLQGDYNQNQLVSNPLYFDKHYVQVLPQTNLSIIPLTLYNSEVPMLQNIAIGADAQHTAFRQVDPDESLYLRNADRIHFNPYLDWNFMDVGPVHLKSRYAMEQQHYEFKRSQESSFTKSISTITSEASFELDRIFGLSYQEQITSERIPKNDLKRIEAKQLEENEKNSPKKIVDPNLVGSMTELDESLTEDYIMQTRNSYRHSQDFRFKHFYTTNQTADGNDRFLNQIGTSPGLFDYLDTIRTRENLLGSNLTRTSISPRNTLEFQWNNGLIKKTSRSFNFYDDNRFLRDNFTYNKIGFFNISQGIEFNTGREKVYDDLTRLNVNTGYTINTWTVGMSDYYFYHNANHILQASLRKGFDYANVFTSINLNLFDNPATAIGMIGANIRPVDIFNFYTKYDYNYTTHLPINTLYGVDYIPRNNCWRLNLNMNKSVVEQRIAFNILVNFSDNTFTPLNTSSGNNVPVGAGSSFTNSPPLKVAPTARPTPSTSP